MKKIEKLMDFISPALHLTLKGFGGGNLTNLLMRSTKEEYALTNIPPNDNRPKHRNPFPWN